MPEGKFDTLILYIDGLEVENIRVFGMDDEKNKIEGFKERYCLKEDCGVSFCFVAYRQSKMNFDDFVIDESKCK